MKKDIASTQSVNDPSRTIEEARLQLGMQPDEVADLVGLTKPNYYDLEAYDDEATSAISLGELLRLCKVLRIQPATLFDDDDPRAGEVAPEDRLPLSDKLKAHLQLTGTTLGHSRKHFSRDLTSACGSHFEVTRVTSRADLGCYGAFFISDCLIWAQLTLWR